LDILPDACHSIDDVKVDGVSVGNVTSHTFTNVQANHTISATFVISTYTLTVTTIGSGSVALSPPGGTYNCGTSVQLTATAATGSHFDHWGDDLSGSTNPISITMGANHTVTATFLQNIYTWNQTGTSAWTTSTNWTPTRSTPSTDDVLLFNNGATATTA